MMATTYLITRGAHTFAAVAIYGCVSGEAGNGRPCRRTRRWAMLRSVERRRGASDENELFGCRLSFAVDAKQIDTSEKEEEPQRIDDGGERVDEMKNRKQTRSRSLAPCNSPDEDLWYIDFARYC